MPRRPKTDWAVGLETMLNNPQASFLHNPKVFHELHKESGMPISSMIKHLGRTAKQQKREPSKPTDKERSESRLNAMEKPKD